MCEQNYLICEIFFINSAFLLLWRKLWATVAQDLEEINCKISKQFNLLERAEKETEWSITKNNVVR